MKTTIGKFDSEAGTVLVRFEHQGVRHKRAVNACRDANGGYDHEATRARVAEVALGVQRKMELGAFGNVPTTPDPVPEPAPPPEPEPEPESPAAPE
jgi:hypothetical protein